jgi:protein-tyrosine phosphatase
MAEGFLRALLPPIQVNVQSAGTLGIYNSHAAENAIRVMSEKSIDISQHRSQGTTHNLISEADLILVMATEHLKYLSENFPERRENIHVLRKFGRERDSVKEPSIPDPIGLGMDQYRKVRDMIEIEIKRILPRLRSLIDDETAEGV